MRIEYQDNIVEVEVDEVVAMEPPASALAYLQSIYRNPAEPDGRRMRAAMAALPFESPKLAATAILNGADFASRLERAMLRSEKVRARPLLALPAPRRSEA